MNKIKLVSKVTGAKRFVFEQQVDPEIIDTLINSIRNDEKQFHATFSEEEINNLTSNFEITKYEHNKKTDIRIASRSFINGNKKLEEKVKKEIDGLVKDLYIKMKEQKELKSNKR
ncbi:MAG: hypothetical protein ACP5RT_02330 [Candidatus Micrarchaeia archaeon]